MIGAAIGIGTLIFMGVSFLGGCSDEPPTSGVSKDCEDNEGKPQVGMLYYTTERKEGAEGFSITNNNNPETQIYIGDVVEVYQLKNTTCDEKTADLTVTYNVYTKGPGDDEGTLVATSDKTAVDSDPTLTLITVDDRDVPVNANGETTSAAASHFSFPLPSSDAAKYFAKGLTVKTIVRDNKQDKSNSTTTPLSQFVGRCIPYYKQDKNSPFNNALTFLNETGETLSTVNMYTGQPVNIPINRSFISTCDDVKDSEGTSRLTKELFFCDPNNPLPFAEENSSYTTMLTPRQTQCDETGIMLKITDTGYNEELVVSPGSEVNIYECEIKYNASSLEILDEQMKVIEDRKPRTGELIYARIDEDQFKDSFDLKEMKKPSSAKLLQPIVYFGAVTAANQVPPENILTSTNPDGSRSYLVPHAITLDDTANGNFPMTIIPLEEFSYQGVKVTAGGTAASGKTFSIPASTCDPVVDVKGLDILNSQGKSVFKKGEAYTDEPHTLKYAKDAFRDCFDKQGDQLDFPLVSIGSVPLFKFEKDSWPYENPEYTPAVSKDDDFYYLPIIFKQEQATDVAITVRGYDSAHKSVTPDYPPYPAQKSVYVKTVENLPLNLKVPAGGVRNGMQYRYIASSSNPAVKGLSCEWIFGDEKDGQCSGDADKDEYCDDTSVLHTLYLSDSSNKYSGSVTCSADINGHRGVGTMTFNIDVYPKPEPKVSFSVDDSRGYGIYLFTASSDPDPWYTYDCPEEAANPADCYTYAQRFQMCYANPEYPYPEPCETKECQTENDPKCRAFETSYPSIYKTIYPFVNAWDNHGTRGTSSSYFSITLSEYQ